MTQTDLQRTTPGRAVRLVIATAGLLWPLATAPVQAQAGGAEVCNAALNKDIVSIIRSDHQQYAYLNRIDTETFEELRRNAGAGLNIPIVEGLIGASASYDDFVRRREKFFQEVNYTADLQYEERLLSVVTNQLAYPAWSACMEAFSRNNHGFHAWKAADRPDMMVISYRWNPPPGTRDPNAISDVSGGTVTGAPAGRLFPNRKKFVPNESGTIQVRRTAGARTLVATLSAEHYLGVTLFSEYDPLRAPVGVAFMRITNAGETLVQTDLATSGTSENNHNKKCPRNGTPCDGSGKWRASIVTLGLDAGAGRVLRNTRVTCDGMPPEVKAQVERLQTTGVFKNVRESFGREYRNVCAYMTIDQEPSDGQRTAVAKVRSWTRPTYFTLHADVYELGAGGTEEVDRTTVIPNETFMLPDHPEAVGRVVVARACGVESPASPGRNSPDGRLQFVGQAGVGAQTILVYRYVVAAGPDGRLPAACGITPLQAGNALKSATTP